tara:strand:+ start:846 stop:1190 length:345 start_codon:yes stop_codon:yes gene_type:complete
MQDDNLVTICKQYFLNFQEKNLDALSNMFDEHVFLKDWNILAEGKSSVLSANSDIFSSIDKIKVDVVCLYTCMNTVVAQLLIHADDEQPLPVVDIIKFDPSTFLIKSITAYRGN